MTRRPNILYIMTDQHRADWLGCAGHKIVRTPNIDRLASRGTRFTNFWVTSPICMPNRGAIFTGRYPSVNGLRHNGLPLPANANTFVDLLRGAGYHTASIGKSHLQPFTDRPVVREEDTTETNPEFPEAVKSDKEDYNNEQPSNYDSARLHEFPRPYYGFDDVRMVTSHSDQCGGHYLQWLRGKTNDWANVRDRANQLPHNYSCPQAFRTPIPEELYPTSYIKEEAKNFLRARGETDEPFFAFVSFPDPHHPFTPPGKYWEMYDPDDFEVTLPYEAHKNPPPQLVEWKRLMDAGIVPKNQQQAFMAPDRQIKEAMALTAGMISMIDDAIGEIIEALEESGKADDTVVIFNADHGDYMGAFSLLLKGPYSHHSVNQVPFIWVDPEIETVNEADGLAASVDIASTILDRCQVPTYHGMQGRSFLDQLSGGPAGRDLVLIEHEENKVYPGFERRPNIRNLITNDYRLTFYKGLDFGELYDLKDDPDATNNLWNNPSASEIRSDMMFKLSQAMLEAIEPGPRPERLA